MGEAVQTIVGMALVVGGFYGLFKLDFTPPWKREQEVDDE